MCLAVVATALPASCAASEPGVLVYGATRGGIAAAFSAAKSGQSVLLVEPSDRIGGLMTCGPSHTDFYSFESLTGSFLAFSPSRLLAFSQRAEAYYKKTYSADSPQVRDSLRGTFGEPEVTALFSVAECLFENTCLTQL